MADREPDWNAILSSEIWREEIAPWLAAMLTETDEKLRTAELKDVRVLQGKSLAFAEVLNTPLAKRDFALAAQKLQSAQEGTDLDGRGDEPLWGRRLARRVHSGS